MKSTTSVTTRVQRLLQRHRPDHGAADLLQQRQLLFGPREALFKFPGFGHDYYYPILRRGVPAGQCCRNSTAPPTRQTARNRTRPSAKT